MHQRVEYGLLTSADLDEGYTPATANRHRRDGESTATQIDGDRVRRHDADRGAENDVAQIMALRRDTLGGHDESEADGRAFSDIDIGNRADKCLC